MCPPCVLLPVIRNMTHFSHRRITHFYHPGLITKFMEDTHAHKYDYLHAISFSNASLQHRGVLNGKRCIFCSVGVAYKPSVLSTRVCLCPRCWDSDRPFLLIDTHNACSVWL